MIVAPGAAGQLVVASAAGLRSLASSVGAAAGQDTPATSGVAWLSWSGRYDLDFARPADARTDPGAAVASRTCARCGATYLSEFTTACEHCGARRPLAWGQWQLTSITAVE